MSQTKLSTPQITPDPKLLPAGGTTDQVLSKIDGTDYHVQWATVVGGGGGGSLTLGIVLPADVPFF